MEHSLTSRVSDLMEGLRQTPVVALESTPATSQSNVPVGPNGESPPCCDITQQGNIYHVSLDIERFYTYSDHGRAFLLWLYQRGENDIIYLSVSTSECMGNNLPFWVGNNTTLFQALTACPATIIGCISSVVMGQDAYVYMACDKLEFGPYAILMVQPLWSGSVDNQSRDQMVCLGFVRKLYGNAVKLQLLTQEEVALLCDGQTVTLSPQDYANASFEHLTFYQEKSRELAV